MIPPTHPPTHTGSQLEFQTNAGEGNYLFEYNETYIGENNELIYGLPPGHFSVICLLGGLPVIEFGVSYTFAGGDGSDVFMVNVTTGALSLTAGAILDYEIEDRYIFNVRCTPEPGVLGTDNLLARNAQVTFSVLPVNEFLPVLTSRNTFVSITESTPIGTVIASTSLASGARVIYSVTDMDRGDNIIYTLDGANLTSFGVDSRGTVTVVQALDTDFGMVGTVVEAIRLIACDVSPPNPQCPNIAIRIIIRGINDNDPVFSQDLYAVTVAESTAFGTLIARVICTDADVGAGEFLSVNSSSNLFNVTSNEAGQDVYLGGQLDYETARSHTATLLCFDTGGKIANATFNLAVEPVNDNPPRFTESSYFFTMNRIFTTGNEVGRVEAIDLDEGIGNQLEYNLTGDDNFRIQNDGSIILRDFVYVVEGQLLDLQVTVSDGQNRDTASVQIRVNGVLSIPEIILVSMGVIIFAFLALFVIVFCCYCCVCCSRL